MVLSTACSPRIRTDESLALGRVPGQMASAPIRNPNDPLLPRGPLIDCEASPSCSTSKAHAIARFSNAGLAEWIPGSRDVSNATRSFSVAVGRLALWPISRSAAARRQATRGWSCSIEMIIRTRNRWMVAGWRRALRRLRAPCWLRALCWLGALCRQMALCQLRALFWPGPRPPPGERVGSRSLSGACATSRAICWFPPQFVEC